MQSFALDLIRCASEQRDYGRLQEAFEEEKEKEKEEKKKERKRKEEKMIEIQVITFMV